MKFQMPLFTLIQVALKRDMYLLVSSGNHFSFPLCSPPSIPFHIFAMKLECGEIMSNQVTCFHENFVPFFFLFLFLFVVVWCVEFIKCYVSQSLVVMCVSMFSGRVCILVIQFVYRSYVFHGFSSFDGRVRWELVMRHVSQPSRY